MADTWVQPDDAVTAAMIAFNRDWGRNALGPNEQDYNAMAAAIAAADNWKLGDTNNLQPPHEPIVSEY